MVKNCACSWPRYVLFTSFLCSFLFLSFFGSCLFHFFKHHFAPKIGAIIITDSNATARLFAAQCRQKWASSHLATSGKESSQAGTAWTSVQVSHQIQAIQHKLTSALSQLYWCRSLKWQSSQKTRIQEFGDVEGNKHCPCVNRVFYRQLFCFQNQEMCWSFETQEKKSKPPKPSWLLSAESKRWNRGACESVWAAMSAVSLRVAVWNWLLYHRPTYSTICSPTQFHSADSAGWKWIFPHNHS